MKKLGDEHTAGSDELAHAKTALEEAKAQAADKEQLAARLESFLRDKARETVALEGARKTAQAAAQRALVELESQRHHVRRMASQIAQLESDLEKKDARLNAITEAAAATDAAAADDALAEHELAGKGYEIATAVSSRHPVC